MKNLIALFVVLSVAAADTAVQEFTRANNLFAQTVYKQVTKTKNGNFLVSPFSAETVLAFAQSGSKDESAEELRNALHLPNDKTKVETAVKTLLPGMKSDDYTLHTANKMYVQNDFTIKNDFKKVATLIYSADIENVEFSKNVEAAAVMNKWVEDQTNNKIKNLINSGDLDDSTAAVLINALYFKANWSTQFSTRFTKTKKFYKTPNDSKELEFMHHDEEYLSYHESPQLKAKFLELKFLGNDASMVIVLPDEKDGIADLEKNLDKVLASRDQQDHAYVNVALPKFKIETALDFTDILKDLGVRKVFDSKEADLSDIAGSKGDLYISKVAQKSFIDVNEGGVEAAAASFVVVSLESAHLGEVKEFNADHPFIFYIQVRDLIIFVGRVTDP